ncbi:MAG: FkbM family methyltransferase [Gallionella sp.]|nr:FkbM family methyltransferase [Gallionella sp.]
MSDGLKIFLRNLLPKKYQVPIKYWNDWQRGTLEEEMKILGLLVRTNDRVIDVGGNRGIYAYQFWKLGALVEVFEPNPICSSILKAWAVGKSAVRVHSVALSYCSGHANLHIPIDASGIEHDASASIENTGFALARDELVVLQTLDSFQFENVSLIKIDVEGHEFSVIKGAEQTIASSRPVLLVEIEQRHIVCPINEVFEKILGLGYQGFFMTRGKLTALENFEVARHQSMENFGGSKVEYINNFLFLHRDRLADEEYSGLLKGPLLK